MKRILLLTTIFLGFITLIHSQNVFNPDDPIVRYDPDANYGSAQRPDTNAVGLHKWVSTSTNGVSAGTGRFDASSYKAYFINYYNTRLAFRLKFPRSYTNADSAGKKYPVMLFMHGAGEVGCLSNGGLYNNEKQLVHGGEFFMDIVDDNEYDGFLLYPQLQAKEGCWGEWGAIPSPNTNTIITIIDSLAKYNRLDIDRVFVDGLSGGAVASWRMAEAYPTRIATIAPTSGAGLIMNYAAFVHIPIWLATGGKDSNPSPAMAEYSQTKVTELGGYMRKSLYEDLGHNSWYRHWAEPDFPEFMNQAHKANPLVFFNRSEFCPDEPGINVKLGITGGFYAYEWEKDDVLIARRTGNTNTIVDGTSIISYDGNEITINSFGVYRVRFRRINGGAWSEWSPRPAVIAPKPITQTPPIQVTGTRSKVVPSLDGMNTVALQLPAGFQDYQWVRTSDNVLVGSEQIYLAPVGTYKARYSEPFGCGTEYSPVFKVVNANGNPKPDAAKNLGVTAVSQTALRLDWSENPNATVNETGFEIYRATAEGGPYTLVKITAPNVITYMDTSLVPNTDYFYLVRAVSETGAAAASNEGSARTEIDDQAPGAPSDLQYRGSTSRTVNLRWKAASDNVGIKRYDIYANGLKLYSTTGLSLTVANLDSLTSYAFSVKAIDKAGNESPASNQVIGYTHRQGLNYKYYHGGYSTLPDFNNLNPEKEGITDEVNAGIGIRTRDDNFALKWEGFIYIPKTESYTFSTSSDDGSRLYIDVPYDKNATPLVDNDGAHAAQSRSGTIYLTEGYHSIVVTYAEVGGDEIMGLFWSNSMEPAGEAIPKEFLTIEEVAGGATVNAPTALEANAVSYNKIALTWIDNSDNEAGFEIVRATSAADDFLPVFTTAGGVTAYTDSALTPGTTYFYKVRAISSAGTSAYAYSFTEANWAFNNNYSEASGGPALNSSGTAFSATSAEGSHSVVFNSNDDYVSFTSGNSGLPSRGGYSQRTVGIWIKPDNGFTGGRRIIFEFGGNDNGLGLRLDNDDLQAGIASSNSRQTVRLSNFTGNVNWQSGQWNHVAVVYDINSLKLFLNGVQVAANNSLPFTSIGNSSNASRIGRPSGANNNTTVFNDGSNSYFRGSMDNLYIIEGALNESGITKLIVNTYKESVARTLDAPAPPAAPSGLTPTVLSTQSIKLTWADNSSDEVKFEIWRASGDKSDNRMVATVLGGSGAQKTFTDTTLFANVTYYYKVRATGLADPSAFSAEVSAKTLNTKPVLKNVPDFTMRYSTTYSLPVKAVDADGDILTFSTKNLPSFGSLENVSNGNINLVFSPAFTRRGSYSILVYVSDGNEGRDTISFVLEVNSNDVPVMSGAPESIVVSEGEQFVVPLAATDRSGTTNMVWYFEGLPSFATFTNNNDGTGALVFAPGYANAGEYEVTAFVDDGFGAWTSSTMVLTVGEKNPEATLQFNFRVSSAPVPLWNSVAVPAFTHGQITDTDNNPSPVSLSIVSGNFIANSTSGPQTSDNNGVYPDLVMKDLLRWNFNMGTNGADEMVIKVSGLTVSKTYNFTFYSGYRLYGDANSVTTFRIGGKETSVKYFMNTSMTGTIEDVSPNASGEVLISMIGDPNTNWGGVLNAMVIKSAFDDGSAPSKPTGFAGDVLQNSGVLLTWTDIAYNETGYQVYRSTNRNSGYAILNEGAINKDSTSYHDATVEAETEYYYYVAGWNGAGSGVSSDTVKITIGNNNPVISVQDDIYVKTDAVQNTDFTVADDPGDDVTVQLVNKPSFVTLQNLGDGSYRLVVSPLTDHIGKITMKVKATDNKGAVTDKNVNITVSDKNTRSVFINFGGTDNTAPAPWNNWLGNRGARDTINNLVDETNALTSFSTITASSWSGITGLGHITGNNSGVVPDAVLQSGIYNNGGERTIRIIGLNNSMRYNIVFVGSQNEGTDAISMYVSGARRDTLNAKYNTQQTANLNGLVPSGGEITVAITRLNGIDGNTVSVLNAMIIEEYTPTITVLNPINLYVEPVDRTSTTLSWSDRTNDEAAVNGYVLERALDSLFTQSVVSFNISGNNTTYRNTDLTSNTKYWYRLRARTAGGAFSDYSNRVKTITPASIVSVSFNYTLPDADYPWNNTFSTPTASATFGDLINESGNISGLSLELVRIFNGEFTAGVNTGNNSGIVPDKVLAANYWLDKTQLSQFKLSGLNHTKRYRIGFIGSSSSVGWFKGNYTATYTINGRTVYLNSWMNRDKIVYIDNVIPDENGEVNLDFSTTQEAMYGFNAGVIIQGYTDGGPGSVETNDFVVVENSSIAVNAPENDEFEARIAETPQGRIYPNPFTDFINMDFNNTMASNDISVEVYDLSGRRSYRKNFGKLPEGNNTLRLMASDAGLQTGVYIVTLSFNGKPVQAGKAIRTNN